MMIRNTFLGGHRTTVMSRASLIAQLVKNPLAMQEIWILSLGWEDPLEKGMVTLQYSSLENSMDCRVHGVAKSRTRLSNFHFTRARVSYRSKKKLSTLCQVPILSLSRDLEK